MLLCYETLYYETTDSASTSDEESDDAENYKLTPNEENNETKQEDKKGQQATNLSTQQEKAMEIPGKKPNEQQANNTYYTEKIKGHRVRSRQTEFLINWQNFPHSELIWDPDENKFVTSRSLNLV